MRKLNRSKSILQVNNVKVIKNSQKLKIKGGCNSDEGTPVVGGHAEIYIVDVEQG